MTCTWDRRRRRTRRLTVGPAGRVMRAIRLSSPPRRSERTLAGGSLYVGGPSWPQLAAPRDHRVIWTRDRLLAAGHVDAPRGTVTGGEVSPAHVPPRRHARRISAVDRLLDWVTRVVALLSWLLRPVKGEQHRTRRPTVGPAGRSLRAVHLFSLQLRPEWTPAGGSLRRWPGPAGPASPRHVTITTYGRGPARAGELLRLRVAGHVDAPRRTGGDVSPAPVPPRRHARRR